MFTGIIEAIGTIASLEKTGSDCRLSINCPKLDMADVKLGDSIAVNGACLTVVTMTSSSFSADVSNESLDKTSLGKLRSGSAVNLEKAMLASSRFGGHIVSGHVDGVGEVVSIEPDGNSFKYTLAAPVNLARYIAAKGSICIDGTSLTVNQVNGREFTVNVIPHTQTQTIIQDYRQSHSVNLEVDLVSRYLERLMMSEQDAATATSSLASPAGSPSIDKEFLSKHGFRA